MGRPGALARASAPGAARYLCAAAAACLAFACGRSGLAVGADAGVEPVTDVVSLAVGGRHGCAVHASGRLSCWGANSRRQLAQPAVGHDYEEARPVALDAAVRRAAAGIQHTCALAATGRAWCWGTGSQGELGDGAVREVSVGVPQPVAGLEGAVEIASMWSHTCAVTAPGEVRCWGLNDRGQLGDGSTTNSPLPVRVEGLGAADSVATGMQHTCALLRDASVWCWGANEDGQLGDGTYEDRGFPVRVEGIDDATRVSAGHLFTCALRLCGAISCWGDGDDVGERGDGRLTDSARPTRVRGIDDATLVTAYGAAACAVRADGSIWCWGSNWDGALGQSPDLRFSPVPVRVPGTAGSRDAAMGLVSGCVLRRDGRVGCWGGAGGLVPGWGRSLYPVPIPGLP